MFIQEFLPRFLVFFGCSVSLAIVDLGGVFQVDVVIHVARDMVGGVGKPNGEPISIFQFNFGVFILEHLLECKAFNSIKDCGHDRTREKIACKGGLWRSGWFGSLIFFFGVGGSMISGTIRAQTMRVGGFKRS